MDTTTTTIGEKLKDIRISLKITQKELGDDIGMKDSQIRRYENGYSLPKASTLETILIGLFNRAVTCSIFPNYYFIQVNDNPDSEVRYNFYMQEYSYFEKHHFGIWVFDLDKNQVRYLCADDSESEEDLKKFFEKINANKKRNNIMLNAELQKQPIPLTELEIFTSGLCGYYSKLNEIGVKKLIDYASDLTKIDEYTKKC